MLVVIRGAGDIATGIAFAAVPCGHSSGADRSAAANIDPPYSMLFGSDSIGRNSR